MSAGWVITPTFALIVDSSVIRYIQGFLGFLDSPCQHEILGFVDIPMSTQVFICCRCHKGEVYIMLPDITSTLILGQYFQELQNTSGLSKDWIKDLMHSFTSFWKWMAYLTIRPLWPCIFTKYSTIYTHFGHILYVIYMWWSIYVLGPGIQWWCLFSHQTKQFWKFPNFPHVHMVYTLFFNAGSMVTVIM